MQIDAENLTAVAHVIQLAVAPVFLLMAISGLLGVLTGRLGRLVDRYRALTEQINTPNVKQKQELGLLTVRAKWVHWSITLSTAAAFFVAVLIAALFMTSIIDINPSRVVSILFITAMTSLIIGLGCFLREISLSVHIFDLNKK